MDVVAEVVLAVLVLAVLGLGLPDGVMSVSPRRPGRIVVHLQLHHVAVRGHDPDLQGRLQQNKKGNIGKVISERSVRS